VRVCELHFVQASKRQGLGYHGFDRLLSRVKLQNRNIFQLKLSQIYVMVGFIFVSMRGAIQGRNGYTVAALPHPLHFPIEIAFE
jgi:hypothetical protein